MKNINIESGQIKLDSDRRAFVKLTVFASAGVAASAVLPGAAMASVAEEKSEVSTQKGYQLTPHVIEYYKSAAS